MKIELQNKHGSEELKALLKNNKDELMKTRIKILLLVKKNLLRKDISERLSVHVDTIADVIRRYNLKGIESLKTNKGGRKEGNPKWDKQIFQDLKEEINKQKEYWSIPKMVKWIKDNRKEDIPEITVWYNMTSKVINMSYKSARTHPQKGDREEQDVFKKKV